MMIIIALFSMGTNTPAELPAPEAPKQPCHIENSAYAVGEKMVFKFYYNWKALWLSAGEMTFRAQNTDFQGRPAIHLRVDGSTYKSYEWFYKVRDVYESYISPVTLMPYRFQRDVNEGGFIIKDQYDFDYVRNKVYTFDYRKEPFKRDTIDIHPCVHDVVSAIYHARNIDYDAYKPGDKIPVNVFIDGKVYDLYIRYMGKKRIKTKMGQFDVLVLKPLMLRNEYFAGGEEMTLYVTDDENKLPVRIESPLTVGWVKVDLIGYSGLRNPFAARVK